MELFGGILLMSTYFRSGIFGFLLLLSADAGEDRSRGTDQTQPQDAVVLVTSHWRETRLASHGLVVGDGSLVVAFYPAVFHDLPSGRQHLAKRVTVASPCWGDVVDAEIVAADAGRYLALFRVPWRGHPALRLADDQSIISADHMVVMGMPTVIAALSGAASGPAEASALFQHAAAEVDYVGIREGKPLLVVLRGAGDIAASWAGAPLLLPDTNRVAATASHRPAAGSVEGGVLNRMDELVNRLRPLEAGSGHAVAEPGTREQGRAAFLLSLRIVTLIGKQQYEEAGAACQEFIGLRPKSFYGYTHAARVAEELEQVSEAERFYQEAVTRAPDSLTAHVSYASFLDQQDRTAEAIQVLEPLWSRTALRPYLADVICPMLTKRHAHNRCLRFLEEALAVDPNNAHALIGLGNSHNALREYGAAAAAFGKAAELWPEHSTVRAYFARNLELADHWDEADLQYRKSVAAHPESEFAHHTFASFLARHRPERRAEALAEARTALRLSTGSAADREKVEKLIRDLEAKGP